MGTVVHHLDSGHHLPNPQYATTFHAKSDVRCLDISALQKIRVITSIDREVCGQNRCEMHGPNLDTDDRPNHLSVIRAFCPSSDADFRNAGSSVKKKKHAVQELERAMAFLLYGVSDIGDSLQIPQFVIVNLKVMSRLVHDVNPSEITIGCTRTQAQSYIVFGVVSTHSTLYYARVGFTAIKSNVDNFNYRDL